MAAKRILTFTCTDVAPLVATAIAATNRRCTFDELWNPQFHRGGVVKKGATGLPDADNIDASKIPAALWLVKDEGVYLMSNAAFKEGQKRADLAYAHEADPTKLEFDEWWENARNIVGGDDCAIALPIEWFQNVVGTGKPTLRLQLLARSIRLL